MTKAHAEFLEELKEYVREKFLNKNSYYWLEECHAYNDVLKKIEQFEAEQKQANDKQ
jgi:hypothetical protein